MMLSLFAMGMLPALMITAYGQSDSNKADATKPGNGVDETAIRSALAEGYETNWNNHQPAASLTSDSCADDAIFINTTGGWVKGRETFAAMITRLHAPGGPFHDHTRRHAIEELRFLRPDVAIAVVKTFDIKRGGVPTTGEETRGLIIMSKEGGHWKVSALENTKIQATVNGER
jgi:uncharacterized protein (TIGR02246 family)